MTWCNYLRGDLFKRFFSNNLQTPSYILWSIQFNCAPCALTQWSSTSCGWWMEHRLHASGIICTWQCTGWCQYRAAFSHHRYLESSLCLSSCWWFSQDQNCTLLSSAWPSVAMATLSSWDWWRVRKAWHSLSQKNYLFTLLSCLYPYRCRTFYNMRDLVTLLRTCWQLNMKLAVTVQFHWLCWINGEMHSIHTFRTDSLRCPT